MSTEEEANENSNEAQLESAMEAVPEDLKNLISAEGIVDSRIEGLLKTFMGADLTPEQVLQFAPLLASGVGKFAIIATALISGIPLPRQVIDLLFKNDTSD